MSKDKTAKILKEIKKSILENTNCGCYHMGTCGQCIMLKKMKEFEEQHNINKRS